MTSRPPGFWPGPVPCRVCAAVVYYSAGRRRCRRCRSWCHDECSMEDRGHSSLCFHCARQDPGDVFRRAARALNGGKEDFPAMQAVLWSCVFGQDEEEMSERLRVPLSDVRAWGSRLRDAGVWEGGHVHLDVHDESDPAARSLALILCALVADGQVVRARGDAGVPPLPGQGGTQQDGNQEREEDQT